MTTLEAIGQEKQRMADRLARLDADRAKLAGLLSELEITERVLSRHVKGGPAVEDRKRGRVAGTAAPTAQRRRAGTAVPPAALSMGDATLKAVEAHSEGATAAAVLSYLSREFGMTVRPNHLGMALQRHRRAGRLQNRDKLWFCSPHPEK